MSGPPTKKAPSGHSGQGLNNNGALSSAVYYSIVQKKSGWVPSLNRCVFIARRRGLFGLAADLRALALRELVR